MSEQTHLKTGKRRSLIGSLTFKVLSIVVLAQLLILSVGGYFYVGQLTKSIDATVENRLRSVGALLQDSQLKYTALSDRDVLTELVGDELLDGMVVGVNGTIYHSLNKSLLGQSISKLKHLKLNWFNPTHVEPQFIRLEEGDETSIVSITPIFTLNSTRPFLFAYIKLDSTSLTQEKQLIIIETVFAALASILLTSFIIYIFLHRFIFRRIRFAADFAENVAVGDYSTKLKASAHDELGVLERGLNQMVFELKERSYKNDLAEQELKDVNENLENRVAERTTELSRTAHDLMLEADSHRKTTDALKKQGAFMQLLQRIIVASNETNSIDEAWKVGLNAIQKHFRWPVGMVFTLKGEHRDIMRLSENVYLEDLEAYGDLAEYSAGFDIHMGEGLVGNVLRSGRPQLLRMEEEVSNNSRMNIAKRSGLGWSFAIPILVGREVVAVMEFFSAVEIEQDSELFEVARDIGIQLGRVMERRRAEQLIQEAKMESDVANYAKTEFISKLGHELRTPINAIVGFSQLMQAQVDVVSSEQRYQQLETITRAGRHLARLVDQMTDLARIEAGELKLDTQHIEVKSVIKETLQKLGSLIEKKNISLLEKLDIPDDYTLNCDTAVLEQIITSLLTNAIHYGGANQTILLQLSSTTTGGIKIVVADQGDPLTPVDGQEIFEPLARLDRHRGLVDGLGIGLTLSREYAQVMGGDIICQSGASALEVDGKRGNSFIVNLPKS
ncbi:sensor histidine kinase [Curvivirga aplysinae]|uniref:sensor histidine kinase n=1 Tax=Curvivirga aplysinae TaxID=2529852 RepID=UPI0012BC1E7D|nr:GAF domain-containing sensor histidine kinase [Curvivirga aplysinae]MTI11430.1 HAMP domain-containing protein [Curvivirga aplysinae]